MKLCPVCNATPAALVHNPLGTIFACPTGHDFVTAPKASYAEAERAWDKIVTAHQIAEAASVIHCARLAIFELNGQIANTECGKTRKELEQQIDNLHEVMDDEYEKLDGDCAYEEIPDCKEGLIAEWRNY